MTRLTAILGLSCLLAAALAGCAEDERPDTIFAGTLVFVDGEIPMPDIEVTLFDPDSQSAVGRDVSDSLGYFEIGHIPPGTYVPVVHANGYRPVFLTQPRWRIERGDQLEIEIRMRRSESISMSQYSLRGRVVDTETREPIANARVEMNFGARGELSQVNWSEYAGWSTTLETTSDEDGMFSLSPLPVIQSGASGEIYVPDFRVTAAGYRSRVMPRNTDPKTVDVSVVGVRLTPGEDLGTIRGVVLGADDVPLAEVPVSVEWRRVDNFIRGFEPDADGGRPLDILIPDGFSWTDETGAFSIGGLPPGFYIVLAGAFPDDGWAGIAVRGVEIPGFNGTGEVELRAFPVIEPVSPADGSVFEATPERLEWVPVATATQYQVRLTRGADGKVIIIALTDPYLEINVGMTFFDEGESFAWEVLVSATVDPTAPNFYITDRPQIFHILRPVD